MTKNAEEKVTTLRSRLLFRSCWALARGAFLAGTLLAPTATLAEIVLQGRTQSSTGAITITETSGVTAGTNLFHSFSVFNIFASIGESVTFTGPNSIENVIARVSGDRVSAFTGLRSSFIDGPLRSNIAGANFFLINSHGITFGPNAQVHVDGSFYASTADSLEFDNGEALFAVPQAGEVLSSAAPAAFGFLNPSPAKISVQGVQLRPAIPAAGLPATLTVAVGGRFKLVGGDIEIKDGAFFTPPGGTAPTSFLIAPSSSIELVSGASAGRVALDSSADSASFESLGTVSLRDTSIVDGHEVHVRSGELIIDNSLISPGIRAFLGVPGPAASGGGVNVNVDNDTVIVGNGLLFGQASLPPAGIFTFSSPGVGGDVPTIDVQTGSLAMTGPTSIRSVRLGPGGAGGISVRSGDLSLRDGATISSVNSFTGAGTDITVEAGDVSLRGDGGRSVTGLIAQSNDARATPGGGFQADAGHITLKARSLEIRDGAQINSDSSAFGRSGDIDIEVDGPVVLDRDGATRGGNIAAQSVIAGDAGRISLRADSLALRNGFQISTTVAGYADAGQISIDVNEDIALSGDNTGIFSVSQDLRESDLDAFANTLRVASFDTFLTFFPETNVEDFLRVRLNDPAQVGSGGAIVLTARDVVMGADTRIDTSTIGAADAGNVLARLRNLTVLDGAQLRSRSGLIERSTGRTAVGPGSGGTIAVNASGDIRVSGTSSISGTASQISTSTLGSGSGGDITLLAQDIRIDNGGIVSAASAGESAAQGDGGTIAVNARGDVTLAGTGSGISTSTRTAGDGGDIDLRARDLVMTDGSSISAESSGTGLAGDIAVNTQRQILLTSSSITTAAAVADGGNIVLNTSRLLDVRDSRITTSVASGFGQGGNISIDPDFVLLQNSSIIANAFGGPGGNINIVAGAFVAGPDSTVDASSAQNIDGNIDIDAPDTDVSSSLVALPESFIDASALLRGECDAVRAGARGNSLVVSGRGGVSPNPDGYLASHTSAMPSEQARLVRSGGDANFQVRVEGRDRIMLATLAGGCTLWSTVQPTRMMQRRSSRSRDSHGVHC